MSYLLRIIDQNLSECEQSITYNLGEDCYSFLASVKNGIYSEGKSVFQTSLDEYFKDIPCSELEKESVRVIVFGKNNAYVVKSHQVAYIVNAETGKTIERIYGQYVKY